jgi:hypothetical protein
LALDGDVWSASRPDRFTPGEGAPDTHWNGGWMDPRAGLEDVERRQFLTLPGLELRPLGRPARSQSLYRLRYTGSTCFNTKTLHPAHRVDLCVSYGSHKKTAIFSKHHQPAVFCSGGVMCFL